MSLDTIPLGNGGYATGVVARMAPRGRIILAYLFGPKRAALPLASDVAMLNPTKAIRRVRAGDLGLMNGSWQVLGDVPGWASHEWPTPPFVRRDPLSKRAWRVEYADIDPSKLVSETSIPYETSGLEGSGLHGYGSVEELMKKELAR
jgi:hypothetical protein